MNEVRFQAALRNQTAVARKVIDAIPLNEWWSVKQIMAELHRQGADRDLHVVEGCLRALREAGLIRLKDNTYQRTAITSKSEEPILTHIVPQVPAAKPAMSATDRLIAAGTRARHLGQELISLANEIEDAVLAMEESRGGMTDAEISKLRQLKSLLKEL